ncbi:MAG: molybdopterin cofactor-binding domain-containing protein [Acidobacteriota bacterium]
MKNFDSVKHVKGESVFVDDIISGEDLLYGVVFTSPAAHGKIKKIDLKEALTVDGVVSILGHHDIPGENQIGAIIKDEELLAERTVRFKGEPILLILAESIEAGEEAREKIYVEIEPLQVITDPRKAFENGDLIVPSRTFSLGKIDKAWRECDVIVEGAVESSGQEHFYMETQGSIAFPIEGDGVKVISSTQSPTAVQRTISNILGISMNKIEVDVRQLGGAFGGKEDQATSWASLAALGTFILKRAVKIVLSRKEDLNFTGKRHPFSSDFKIGLKKNGKILAYEATYYQNCGAFADLSTAILERALLHSTNSYYIPHVNVTGLSCYTNLPPFTAFRGFGAPQAIFVIESAIKKAAKALGIEPRVIQKLNLLEEGDQLPYGMRTENYDIRKSWNLLESKFGMNETFLRIKEFNKKNILKKRGAAVMPVTFGISFTNSILNQAGALVHIYTDGSVSVSTGAVEMGQGVNMKILSVAASVFSIPRDFVKMETTNTTRVANTSPTAASSGADLNGKATETACENLIARLKKVAAQELNSEIENIVFKDAKAVDKRSGLSISWNSLIASAYNRRVNLSSQAYYATPDIWFDKKKEKGKPFSYHVYGTALVEAEVDIIKGTYKIVKADIVHDLAKSINKTIDTGQVEGAFIQGLGWMIVEELIYDEKGTLITGNSSTYKIPDMKFTDCDVAIEFLTDEENPYAVMGSKAVGEPPFMYGIGGYFAVQNGLISAKSETEVEFNAPITPEKALLFLLKN